jgi:hypothetical protein
MRLGIAGVLLGLGFGSAALASEETMYVSGDGLNVRYCAASNCCIADRLRLNDPVSVMEREGRWARISVFHDAKITGRGCEKPEDDSIAHWVSLDYLTTQVPDGTDPNAWFGLLSDRRIRGVPKVGDYGLTRADLEIIRRYASSLLLNGECEGIDTGNKSVSREGTYYVACEGETEQRYFTAADIAS